MRKVFIALALSLCPVLCMAGVPDLSVQTRFGFVSGEKSGFRGDYLNMIVRGDIGEHFSYGLRQRFNKPITDGNIFQATDWVYLKYSANDWELTAGKTVLECGGLEYDAVPIDVYYAAEYWNNAPGFYNFSVGAARYFGFERICFQFGVSPFTTDPFAGLYSYNLSFRGGYGCFDHMYSVNFFEQEKGVFSSQVFLGNRFIFGPVKLELDLIHRLCVPRPSFFKDLSTVGRVSVSAADWLDVFAKAAYDKNSTADFSFVVPGTDLLKIGGGVEVYPVKGRKNVRIHCLYYYGPVSNFMLGLTFNANLLKSK